MAQSKLSYFPIIEETNCTPQEFINFLSSFDSLDIDSSLNAENLTNAIVVILDTRNYITPPKSKAAVLAREMVDCLVKNTLTFWDTYKMKPNVRLGPSYNQMLGVSKEKTQANSAAEHAGLKKFNFVKVWADKDMKQIDQPTVAEENYDKYCVVECTGEMIIRRLGNAFRNFSEETIAEALGPDKKTSLFLNKLKRTFTSVKVQDKLVREWIFHKNKVQIATTGQKETNNRTQQEQYKTTTYNMPASSPWLCKGSTLGDQERRLVGPQHMGPITNFMDIHESNVKGPSSRKIGDRKSKVGPQIGTLKMQIKDKVYNRIFNDDLSLKISVQGACKLIEDAVQAMGSYTRPLFMLTSSFLWCLGNESLEDFITGKVVKGLNGEMGQGFIWLLPGKGKMDLSHVHLLVITGTQYSNVAITPETQPNLKKKSEQNMSNSLSFTQGKPKVIRVTAPKQKANAVQGRGTTKTGDNMGYQSASDGNLREYMTTFVQKAMTDKNTQPEFVEWAQNQQVLLESKIDEGTLKECVYVDKDNDTQKHKLTEKELTEFIFDQGGSNRDAERMDEMHYEEPSDRTNFPLVVSAPKADDSEIAAMVSGEDLFKMAVPLLDNNSAVNKVMIATANGEVPVWVPIGQVYSAEGAENSAKHLDAHYKEALEAFANKDLTSAHGMLFQKALYDFGLHYAAAMSIRPNNKRPRDEDKGGKKDKEARMETEEEEETGD